MSFENGGVIEVGLKVGRIRMICGTCRRFLGNTTLQEAEFCSFSGCKDHPFARAIPDFSATEMSLVQTRKE